MDRRIGVFAGRLALFSMLGIAMLVPAQASAADFVVNTLSDGSDANTADTVCEATMGTGDCTLRAAIEQSNANGASSDQITFSVTGTHPLVLGQLVPNTPMTITGNGSGASGTVVDVDVTARAFFVDTPGPTTVTIAQLRVKDGLVNTAVNCCHGAGIFNRFGTLNLDHVVVTGGTIVGGVAGVTGAGVTSDGPLNVTDSTIDSNTITAPGGAGAGIAVNDVFKLVRSTVSRNVASESNGGSAGGVNIANQRTGIEVTSSTISGNRADPTVGTGGLRTSSTLAITNSTISNNTAVTGGINATSGVIANTTLENTILAGNTGPNCATSGGATFSGTNSIDSGTSCGFGNTNGNQSSTDPLLASLADNGGPTETHALALTSPAIDTGSADCGSPPAMAADVSTDQRLLTRPQGPACDVGAFEYRYRDLTVQKSGSGSGVVSGMGVACGSDCAGSYREGFQVFLTAAADAGSSFAGWSGCDSANGNQCTMTMGSDKTVTANFELVPQMAPTPPALTPSLTPALTPRKCKKGRKLKKGKCVKKKRKKN